MDKENVHHANPITTRIPIPLHPLPALPDCLVKRSTSKCRSFRNPLETLHEKNINFSSASNASMKDKNHTKIKRVSRTKLDTRHVTIRQKEETLDWEFQDLFRDSSDEDIRERKCDHNAELTPRSKVAEHKNSRNIKQSLKRPHSREIQGLSPGTKQKRIYDKAKRVPKPNQSLKDILQPPDVLSNKYMQCLVRDYTDDLFTHLLNIERKPLGVSKLACITRACVINWLMKVNGADGNPAVVQSACWYMDSILGIYPIRLKKLQLVATACYWVAQKIHGVAAAAGLLVSLSNNAFSVQELMMTEKTVVEKLKFPPQPVVPQEYITYWSWICNPCNPGEIAVAATFICMSGLMVIKALNEEYPSVVAAAAVTSALHLLGKTELLALLQLCPIYRSAEMKTPSMSTVLCYLRCAVRTVSSPAYSYRTPLEHYGAPPHGIACKVADAARFLVSMEDIRTRSRESFREMKF